MDNDLINQLRTAGYKITPARLAVLQVLAESADHLVSTTVLERGRAIYPKLGRATVYRTLELLTELRVLRPIYGGSDGLHFIRAEGGHHHLVCADCGDIVEFDDCVATELAHDLEDRFGFTIQSHLLEFYGVCAQCASSANI